MNFVSKNFDGRKCQSPTCDNLIETKSKGRSPKYCKPACRQNAFRKAETCNETPNRPTIEETPRTPISLRQKPNENNGVEGAFSALKPADLKWERVNDVTWKLAVKGKVSHTPASHGQWPGYHTSYPAAWLMRVNWWAGSSSWVGRCRDERGDWTFGPTTFEEAKQETRAWVLGETDVGGFADDSIRELHESALLAERAK